MMQRVWIFPALLALFAITGCGPGGPAEYSVTGMVNFEGAPIPEGDIIFEPADGKTQHRATKIVNGRYEVAVPPGPKVVKIMATKEDGVRDKVMNMVARRQYIPPQYNAQSELKAEVTSDSLKNHFDFNLGPAKPAAP